VKRQHATVITAILVLAAGSSLSADRIKLRSGKAVEGMFIGGDSKSVRILLDDGSVTQVPLEEAAGVEFSARKPPPPPPPPPPPAPKPVADAPPPRKTVSVPAGTLVNVRLTSDIDVDASRAGQTFKAIVDDPVMLSGAVVIPRGATAVMQAVNVQQSGQFKGSDKISLKLNAISFGGTSYEVTTAYVESKGKGEGKRTARKIGGGAGLGAIVGGIAGGGEGAAIGAAIGGVTGVAMSASGEEHLKLPAETRLQFRLNAAVNVQQ
jgi:hypothetical protein